MSKHQTPSRQSASRRGSSTQEKGKKGEALLVMVMGATGTGKSTFVNNASGGRLLVGSGLESCTKEVSQSSTLPGSMTPFEATSIFFRQTLHFLLNRTSLANY
ncbi:hypothetical protein PM082_002134 [Marasmius tenuissimus]|nr:hypothetical protein PM082_002134 [Marasmius tenuissimus]